MYSAVSGQQSLLCLILTADRLHRTRTTTGPKDSVTQELVRNEPCFLRLVTDAKPRNRRPCPGTILTGLPVSNFRCPRTNLQDQSKTRSITIGTCSLLHVLFKQTISQRQTVIYVCIRLGGNPQRVRFLRCRPNQVKTEDQWASARRADVAPEADRGLTSPLRDPFAREKRKNIWFGGNQDVRQDSAT